MHLDAHVLSSPTLADVNGDGHIDVIMSVSYYFDKAEYAGRADLDFDPTMYVAGGVVVWDLKNQNWAWTVHLDLTTDHTTFKVSAFSSILILFFSLLFSSFLFSSFLFSSFLFFSSLLFSPLLFSSLLFSPLLFSSFLFSSHFFFSLLFPSYSHHNIFTISMKICMIFHLYPRL